MAGLDLLPRLRLMAIADATISAARIGSWAAGGVTAVQLRDKSCPDSDFVSAGRRSAAACHDADLLFIINDRWALLEATGADGVHLGQQDEPLAARNRVGAGAILGISVCTVEQAKAAARAGADYLGVGPIFSTAGKTDAWPAGGLAMIAAIRSAFPNVPLVAIGGINADNAAGVLAAGADGLAAIAALAADPEPAAAALRRCFPD